MVFQMMLYDVATALNIPEIVLLRKQFKLQKRLMKRNLKLSYLTSKSNIPKEKHFHPKIYYVRQQDYENCQFLEMVGFFIREILKI